MSRSENEGDHNLSVQLKDSGHGRQHSLARFAPAMTPHLAMANHIKAPTTGRLTITGANPVLNGLGRKEKPSMSLAVAFARLRALLSSCVSCPSKLLG
jgi:hypothetical protein